MEGLRAFLGSLWSDTGLSARLRELVILAIAAETESVYEWHAHVLIARNESVSTDEIRAISESRFESFEPNERALLRYAVAVARDGVTDDYYESLRGHFPDDATLVGITALASGYVGLSLVLSALDIEPDDAFVGWELENQ